MESAQFRNPADPADDGPEEGAVAEVFDYPDRAARLCVKSLVTLNADWGCVQAKACDVSPGGLKIEVSRPLAPGPINVKLPGFPIFSGEVRWHDARHAGVRFLQPIPMEFLAIWVKVHGLADLD